jgi:hypothetical protein
MDAPDVIVMKNNLPMVNDTIATQPRDAIQRCPTGAIVWMETDGKIILGKDSKTIVRDAPLEPMPS